MTSVDVRYEIREAIDYAEGQLCGRNQSWGCFARRVADLEKLVAVLAAKLNLDPNSLHSIKSRG